MSELKVGLQMMMFRDKIKEDGIDTVLKTIKEIGINHVEFSQIVVNDDTVPQIVKLCKNYEINICSNSVTLERFFYPNMPGETLADNFEQVIAQNRALGCSYVRIGMVPLKCIGSEKEYYHFAAQLEKYGEMLNNNGIKLYYHNHNFELEKFNGKYALDIIAENTSPEHVGLELDTHWLQRGGQNPIEWLTRHAGRVDLVHLKDYRICVPPVPANNDNLYEYFMRAFSESIQFAEVGEGNLDFNAIISTCEKVGTRYMIIEQDLTYGRDIYDSIAISVANLKKMGYSDNF